MKYFLLVRFVVIVLGTYRGVVAGKPTMLPQNNQLVIQEGSRLKIVCYSKEAPLQFSFPNYRFINFTSSEYEIVEDDNGTSTFLRHRAISADSGWYGCAEEGISMKFSSVKYIDYLSTYINWIYVDVQSPIRLKRTVQSVSTKRGLEIAQNVRRLKILRRSQNLLGINQNAQHIHGMGTSNIPFLTIIGTSQYGRFIGFQGQPVNTANLDLFYEIETDQQDEVTSSTNDVLTSGCILPEQPTGGNFQLDSCIRPCDIEPGIKVSVGSILTYTCDAGYILKGNAITVCRNSIWYMPPTCVKACQALKSDSLDIICKRRGEIVSCEFDMMPETVATLTCKSFFKPRSAENLQYRKITCMENGTWDRPLLRCFAECGVSIARESLHIGRPTVQHVFPWHVGVQKKMNDAKMVVICGGTLISSDLVVSAAHCFYDESSRKLWPSNLFAIVTAKYKRGFDWPQEDVQISTVRSLTIPTSYYGLFGMYAKDIALVRLYNPFNLNVFIRPICLDWNNIHETEHFQSGNLGKVGFWGKTDEDDNSKEVRETHLPFISFSECISAVTEDFRPYLTMDKFCTGYLNGSRLCQGESGGGIAFRTGDIWYLRGIVSVAPHRVTSRCDSSPIIAFTNVGKFIDWIRIISARHK